jgi:hypothetical protein
MKRTLAWLMIAGVVVAGCDDGKKKAEEEAKAAASAASVAAAKASAELEAKAKEAAKAALASKKTELTKSIKDSIDALDRKATYLKEKAAKLTGPAKAKAETAFAAYDKAKGAVSALTAAVEGATELSALNDLSAKITAASADATKALNDYEAAVIPPKK